MKTLNDYMAMSYRMEIVEDKDEGGFVVNFPDLPGCLTCGETVEERWKMLRTPKDVGWKRRWRMGSQFRCRMKQKIILANSKSVCQRVCIGRWPLTQSERVSV